jgi:glycosyltransferase involved in cell wall biosynthesis
MRIFQANLYLHAYGGTEQSMLDLSSGLEERGHTVGFLYHVKNPETLEFPHRPSYHTPVLKAHFRPQLKELYRLAGILREARADVVLLQNVYNIWAILLIQALVPTVRYVRSHELYCIALDKTDLDFTEGCRIPHSYTCVKRCRQKVPYPARLGNYLYRKAEILVNKRLFRLLVTSEYMKSNLLLNGFPERKIRVLPPYADNIRATPPRTTAPVALFVGRLENNKGGALLLELVAGLPEGARLDVVGDGALKEKFLAGVEEPGLQGRTVYRGWLEREEVKRAYDEARVVIFPSVWEEPFGRIGLEAMAAGKPVVAFDVGGVRDWLEPGVNGFLVPRGDVAGMAEKTSLLLNDQELCLKMGEAGRTRALRLFSRDRVIDNLEEVLQEAVDSRRSGSFGPAGGAS